MFQVRFGGERNKREQAAAEERYPNQPWMVRPDWAAGKIKATTTAPIGFFLLWSFLALAITAPIVYQLLRDLRKGDPAILIALIFPVIAFFLLVYSFRSWRARRRFGDCFFEPAQTPTPVGGVLEGMIQTGKPVKLEHDLHLTISCIRRVVERSGKNSNTSENILWQNEKVYTAQANLPQTGPGQNGIPVHFQLPAGKPESYKEGNETILWRLEAKSPGFHVAFEIPVFIVAGAPRAEADDDVPDPTAALQASIEEIRRDEHSRIQVNDGPNGREFYFPAARNVGACMTVTLFALIFDGIAVVISRAHTPLLVSIIFPAAFGFFGLLLTIFAFSAWFKSSRVTVNSSGLEATDRWLLYRRSRQFNVGDIERLEVSAGTTSGTKTYWDIKLIQRGQSNFEENKARYLQQTGQVPPLQLRALSGAGCTTIASALSNRAEADWLVAQMTTALGRVVARA